MKFLVITKSDLWITDADTIEEACEQFDWKYPGTVISVSQLPNDISDVCPLCGSDMKG